MSRTYRRKKGDQDWKRWLLTDWRLEREHPGLPRAEAVIKITARYHADGAWTMTTPGWWIREFMTVPQRALTRKLVGEVLRLKDLEDAPIFPLPKKPHHYYW